MSQQDLAAGTSAAEPAAKKAAPPWLWDLLLLGALWGASFLFMRIGAREFGALPTAALRVAVATLFLLPLLLWRGQAPDLARIWKPALTIGVFNSGLPCALFAFALISLRPKAGLGMHHAGMIALAGLAFFLVRTGTTTWSFLLYDQSYKKELKALKL